MTSTIDAGQVRAWIGYYGDEINRRADELNRLDAALGDGDFGASMQRGIQAVAESPDSLEADSIGEILRTIGMTLVSAMGGTSGPLVGTLFLRAGMSIGDAGEVDVDEFAAAMRAGADGVAALGQASPGDKTMLDSLVPAVEALEAASGGSMEAAAEAAAAASFSGAEATADLVARRGRASYVRDGGRGNIDPGAVGMAILFEALVPAVRTPSAGDS